MAKEPQTETLPLGQIRTDGGTQVRAEIDEEFVQRYVEALAEGEQFPPVVVFCSSSQYWLADGFHRLAAYKKAGRTEIECEIHEGARTEAILYAVGANARHGKPRTNDDKRRAVEILLKNREWGQWSDREIARRCCVSHNFVGEVRRQLSSDDRRAPRTCQRNGKSFSMDTAKIGRGQKAASGTVDRASESDEEAVASRPQPAQCRRAPVPPRKDLRPPTAAVKPEQEATGKRLTPPSRRRGRRSPLGVRRLFPRIGAHAPRVSSQHVLDRLDVAANRTLRPDGRAAPAAVLRAVGP